MSLPSFNSFIPGNELKSTLSLPALWFILKGSDLLVARPQGTLELPLCPDPFPHELPLNGSHFLGMLGDTPCMAAGVPLDAAAPAGWAFEEVRNLFGTISDSFFCTAARALEIIEWDRTHRFCGTCGGPTTLKPGERARECTACGHLSYPRISPAVIVAVTRGDRILLARARRFPSGLFSVLAGFVEPGENLEECVVREVREETGIAVKNLRYFGSQPWPFPHSLMIAFTAEHAEGEIVVDPTELVEADWFAADALPHLPDPLSIARRLINSFVAAHAGGG